LVPLVDSNVPRVRLLALLALLRQAHILMRLLVVLPLGLPLCPVQLLPHVLLLPLRCLLRLLLRPLPLPRLVFPPRCPANLPRPVWP
jgi:hypothetical protein